MNSQLQDRWPRRFLKFGVRDDGVIIPVLRRSRDRFIEGPAGAEREIIPELKVKFVEALRSFISH